MFADAAATILDITPRICKSFAMHSTQVRRISNIDPAITSKVDSSMKVCREHVDIAIRLCDKHMAVQATGAKGKVKGLV